MGHFASSVHSILHIANIKPSTPLLLFETHSILWKNPLNTLCTTIMVTRGSCAYYKYVLRAPFYLLTRWKESIIYTTDGKQPKVYVKTIFLTLKGNLKVMNYTCLYCNRSLTKSSLKVHRVYSQAKNVTYDISDKNT